MGWIYLAASEASDKPWLLGSEQSPTVKQTERLAASCFQEWAAARLTSPASGTTCSPSTPKSCETLDPSTSSSAASPARTSRSRAKAPALAKAPEAASLPKSSVLLANFDPATSSWKTFQQLLFAEGSELLATLPKRGMTRNGSLYQLPMLERRTAGIDGGAWQSWPTPQASAISNDLNMRSTDGRANPNKLGWAVGLWRTPDTGAGGTSERLRKGETHRPSGAAITVRLIDQVQGWPTPRGEDAESAGAHHGKPDSLGSAAKVWPTPRASDFKGVGPLGSKSHDYMTEKNYLSAIATGWATPQARDYRSPDLPGTKNHDRKTALGYTIDLNSQAAHHTQEIGTPGQKYSEGTPKLNPLFVEWLLGYRIGTTAYEPWVTQSTWFVRGKRSKS